MRLAGSLPIEPPQCELNPLRFVGQLSKAAGEVDHLRAAGAPTVEQGALGVTLGHAYLADGRRHEVNVLGVAHERIMRQLARSRGRIGRLAGVTVTMPAWTGYPSQRRPSGLG
jgi:hypothetical protein